MSLVSSLKERAVQGLWRLVPEGFRPIPPRSCHGGVEGLDGELGEMRGGALFALSSSQPGWANVLAATLVGENHAQTRIFMVAESADLVLALSAYSVIEDAIERGRLIVWVMTSNAQTVFHATGFRRLFADLIQAGLTTNDLLVFAGSAPLLRWKRIRQVRHQLTVLHRWAARRAAPTCLLLMPGEHQGHGLEMVHDNRHLFDGVARVVTEDNKPTLLVEQWDSPKGPVLGRRFGLKLDLARQRFRTDGVVVEHASDRLIHAPDLQSVIATRAVVANEKGVPTNWKVVFGGHAVGAAARDMTAGVILLDVGGRREFPALAHVIHGIRLEHTRAVKIVLRETTEKTRYHHELSLLALGATAIVPRETPFSRLVQMVDDLVSTTHVRDIESNIDGVLAAAESPPYGGYLPVAAFAQAARKCLEGTEIIELTHCLVRLPLLARTSHLQALKSCHTTRRGDFFTLEPTGLTLFLYACREPDVEATLGRVLSVPVSELFSSIIIDTSREGIAEVVDHLDDAASEGRLPDYTLYVGSHAPDSLVVPDEVAQRPSVLAQSPLVTAEEAALSRSEQGLSELERVDAPINRAGAASSANASKKAADRDPTSVGSAAATLQVPRRTLRHHPLRRRVGSDALA